MAKNKRIRQMFGAVLLAAAGGIFATNLYGLTQSLRHPDLLAFDAGTVAKGRTAEIGYSRITDANSFGIKMTRADALAAYAEARTIADEPARIRRITEIVTASTVHYYPVARRGTAFSITAHENFLLWALAQFSPLIERLGFAPQDPYEFLQGAKSWERGAGLCGELATIAIHLLQEAGIKAGKAALQGHVVALAQTTDGSHFVVDPDYGFVIEGRLDEVASQPSRIVAAARSGGHTLKAAQNLAKIYGPEGNIAFWNGDRAYRPLGYWIERIAYALKWLLPVAFAVAGFLLFRLRRSQRPLDGDVGPSQRRR
ncbi:MAG: hypothetical protein MJE12_08345 [Alphaproteobacteria bacterium]|nr:hypothetical protein [Alphaproteobacteria bacterium]